MAEETKQSRVSVYIKRYSALILVFILLALLAGGYAFGYRPGPGLTLVRVGMLTIDSVPDGTNVYADMTDRGAAANGSLTINLVPGNHTIIVDAPNDEPWESIVDIQANETTVISPILVPKQVTPVTLNDADRNAALTAITATTVPSEAAPLTLGCVQVYESKNRIITSLVTTPACTPPSYVCTGEVCAPTITYSPAAPIHSIIAYPGRTDAVIAAVGDWIYVIALDPRAPQFFAPVIRGVSPVLAPDTETPSSFIVLDSGKTYRITF